MKFRTTLCIVMLVNVASAAQVDYSPAEAPPVEQIGKLAVSSDLVVIGTITQSIGVAKRLTAAEITNTSDLSSTLGGTVYTFKVEKLLCTKNDFRSNTSKPRIVGRSLQIFQRRDEPFSRRPLYLIHERYLIFLVAVPNQQDLRQKYQLRLETYYEPWQAKTGLVSIHTYDLPFLKKLERFCDALAPRSSKGKLDRLQHLKVSDPDLGPGIDLAISIIHQNLR